MNDKVVIEGEVKLSTMIDGDPQHWVGASGVETESLSVTENGVYTAPSGIAYTPVTVNVAGIIPSGTKEITANGNGIDVYEYAAVDVNVPNPPTAEKSVTANGTYTAADDNVYGFSKVNVSVPLWWIGDAWEKLPNCWDETTTLKAVGFDSWTASTTAGTLRAGAAANQFSADMANYDYLIRWRFLWNAAYKSGATLVAIPVLGSSDLYQFITRRPQSLADVRAEEYTQNTYALYYSMLYQEYYNTSGNHTANWANAYGITITAVAPSYSGGDNITVTPNYPSIGARCNNSYFATARKADIDSENSTIRLVGEVYRVRHSALRQAYEDVVKMVNNGL